MSFSGGVVAGVVLEVDASQGRVRVKYVQIEDDLESPWAYVAAPLAGPSRGMLFMPEVGDEVLVIHGNNDFDHPYVLGYLWNGQQQAPESDPKLRVIKTPGGHQLRFEDVDGAKKVVLLSDGGRSVTLDDAPGAGRIEIKSGENLVLLDDAPGGTKLQLRAGQAAGVSITMTATPMPALNIDVAGGSTTIGIDATGVTLTTAALVNLNCSSASLTSAAALTITAATVAVNSAFTRVSGVVQCDTLITNAVVSPSYTPGVGNIW